MQNRLNLYTVEVMKPRIERDTTHFFSHVNKEKINLEKLSQAELIAELLAYQQYAKTLWRICMESRKYCYHYFKNTFTAKRKRESCKVMAVE